MPAQKQMTGMKARPHAVEWLVGCQKPAREVEFSDCRVNSVQDRPGNSQSAIS